MAAAGELTPPRRTSCRWIWRRCTRQAGGKGSQALASLLPAPRAGLPAPLLAQKAREPGKHKVCPPYPTDFTSADSTNCRLKIFGKKKKIPESSQKQNLNLPHAEHYAESSCTDRSWTSAAPTYARARGSENLGIRRDPETDLPWTLRDNCTRNILKFSVSRGSKIL